MTRPLALTGFTLFLVLAFLCDKDIKTAVILLSVFAAAFAVTLAVRAIRRSAVFTASTAAGIVACVLFIAAMQLDYLPATAYSGSTRSITAVLTDGEYFRNGRYYCNARVVLVDGEAADFRIRISSKAALGLEPYDRVSGNYTVFTIGGDEGENVGGNRANGVYVGGYSLEQVECERVPNDKKPFGYRIFKIREAVKSKIYDIFPNETGALIIALLIGDTGGISPATLAAFRSVGVSHIISVSGLHLSVWALFLMKLSGNSRRSKKWAAAASILLVVAFSALTGFTYSVMRSAVMCVIMLLGVIVSREKDSVNSLGAAALLILVFRPFAAGDISFQLSFLSTLGIIWGFRRYAGKINETVNRIKTRLLSQAVQYVGLSALTTASAVVFTLPVTLRVWNTLNFITAVSNLLIVFAATVCMVSGGLTVLSAFIPIVGGICAVPACVAGLSAKYIIAASKLLSRGPFLTLSFDSDLAAVWLAGALMLAAVGVLVSMKRKNAVNLTAALCAVSFTVMIAVSAIESGSTRIITADVGNGTAVIVKNKGCCALIGCGGDEYYSSTNIADLIKYSGTGRLDLMIVPRLTQTEAACAADLLLELIPSTLAYNELSSDAKLLAPRSRNVGCANAVFELTQAVSIKCVSNSQSCYAVVYIDNTRVLISMYPGGYIEPEDRSAQALICRSDVPKCLDSSGYELVVLTGADKAYAVQNGLLSQGIFAAATAGEGNIIIRTSGDGDIAACREN